MIAGGLGSVLLGSRATPTRRVGSIDDRCDDGHGLGAVAGFFGAGDVPCGDDVDCWSWGWSICMIVCSEYRTLEGLGLLFLDTILACINESRWHRDQNITVDVTLVT